MTDDDKGYVFISYSSADLEDVEQLVTALEARGVRCWYAARNIQGSYDYAEIIPPALEAATATLVVLSKDAIRSRHVRRELDMSDRLDQTLYAVRLLDVALSNEMAYFIRMGAWLDLDSGRPSRTYDLLAQKILSGEALTPQKARGSRRMKLGIAAGVAAIGLASAGALLWTGSDDGGLGIDVYTWQNPGSEWTGLHDTTVSLYTELPQDDVEIALYQKTAADTLRKVGIFAGTPRTENGETNAEFASTEAVNDGMLCVIHDGTSWLGGAQRMVYIRRVESHTDADPDAQLRRAPETGGCDAAMGYTDDGSLDAQLRPGIALQNALDTATIAVSGDIKSERLDKAGYAINQSLIGKRDPAALRQIEAHSYVLGSDDGGESWYKVTSAPLIDNAAFTYRYSYSRILPPQVRQCTETRLPALGISIESRRDFVLVGDAGNLQPIGPAQVTPYFDGPAPCAEMARNSASRLPPTPYQDILLDGSGGTFDVLERERAVQTLAAGHPLPYGPQVNGLQLGMPFEDAVAVVQKQMPLAAPQLTPHRETMPRVVSFFDGVKLVRLMEFDGIAALAGMTVDYRPPGATVAPVKMVARVQDAFGAPNGRRPEDFPSVSERQWGWEPSYNCDYPAYSKPEILAALNTLKCDGLFLKSRISMGGRGSSYVDLGLFDASTNAALAARND